MIARAKEDHPALGGRGLCRMFSVSRSWYYERSGARVGSRADVELRDAVEHIVSGFPGATAIAGSPKNFIGGGGPSITNGFCESCAKNRFCGS